jgi:hypothetical protein
MFMLVVWLVKGENQRVLVALAALPQISGSIWAMLGVFTYIPNRLALSSAASAPLTTPYSESLIGTVAVNVREKSAVVGSK